MYKVIHEKSPKTEEVATTYLERLLNILILNSSFIASIGLEGKTGVCILFFELFVKTKRKELFMFASKLLDELFNGLKSTKEVPIGVSNGICGLGIGLSYLKGRRFVDCSDQAVFSILDEAIFSSPIATHIGDKDFLSKELYYFSRFGFELTAPHFVDYSKSVLQSLLKITSDDQMLSNRHFLPLENLSNALYLLNGLKSGSRNEDIAELLDEVIASLCHVIIRKPSLIKYDFYGKVVLRQLELILAQSNPKDLQIRQYLEEAIATSRMFVIKKSKKNRLMQTYCLFHHFYVFKQHDIYFDDMDNMQAEDFVIEQFEKDPVLDCQIKELLNVGYMIKHLRYKSEKFVASTLAKYG